MELQKATNEHLASLATTSHTTATKLSYLERHVSELTHAYEQSERDMAAIEDDMEANYERSMNEIPPECDYFQIMLGGASKKNGPVSVGEVGKLKELHGMQWLVFVLRRKVQGYQMLYDMATSNPY